MLSISLYLGVSSRNTGKNARISLYTCCDRGLSRPAISKQSTACLQRLVVYLAVSVGKSAVL